MKTLAIFFGILIFAFALWFIKAAIIIWCFGLFKITVSYLQVFGGELILGIAGGIIFKKRQ